MQVPKYVAEKMKKTNGPVGKLKTTMPRYERIYWIGHSLVLYLLVFHYLIL